MLSETSKQFLRYSANPDQIFYAQRMRMSEGKMDGLDVIDVDNGGGLHFWVLPGRGLDIGRLSLNGKNISFLSKSGFTQAAHYDADGLNGMYTFAGGFMCTCGLRNSGDPSESEGEQFGFHGRIGQTPAESISIRRDLYAERPSIQISGRILQGKPQDYNDFEETRISVQDFNDFAMDGDRLSLQLPPCSIVEMTIKL